jgi:predicted dehydrogenase
MTGIAFVGTGFVADYYMTTLVNHPQLKLRGAWDREAAQLERFTRYYGTPSYESYEQILADPDVSIVVNLSSPQSHFDINRQALDAGKNVYCEKPLAMRCEQAGELVALAGSRGLSLCSAPANAYSDAFRQTEHLLESGEIGTPRAAFAEMEDGPVHWDNWRQWKSVSGAAWPGIHEFELGCTLEHAGYALSWLLALFGPVRSLTSSASLVFPDKGSGTENLSLGPDLTVGLLQFDDGISARLTCSLVSERVRSLTIMGDTGVLVVRDLWDYHSPIDVLKPGEAKNIVARILGRLERKRGRALPIRPVSGRQRPYGGTATSPQLPSYPSQIDFSGGIARQAAAMGENKKAFFSGPVAAHMTEITLALGNGEASYKPEHVFDRQSAGRVAS